MHQCQTVLDFTWVFSLAGSSFRCMASCVKCKLDMAMILALARCVDWHISILLHLLCERGAAVRPSADCFFPLNVRACAHHDDLYRKKISHLRGRALALPLLPCWELVRIVMWCFLLHSTLDGLSQYETCRRSSEN